MKRRGAVVGLLALADKLLFPDGAATGRRRLLLRLLEPVRAAMPRARAVKEEDMVELPTEGRGE